MYLADSFAIGYLLVGNWKLQSYSGFEPGYGYVAYRVVGVAAVRAGVGMAFRFTLYFALRMSPLMRLMCIV